MDDDAKHTPRTHPDEFLRLPGLFRRWELPDVLEAGPDFHFEDTGTTTDGTPLFAVYRREHTED